ncbi:MAG: GAF and ANTAR domain-containing protein [Desulfobacula sp.]|jgi:signal transduction protein with GAF and PtsI domain|nr:GAF and ANTAR domain-containing protein [Desulfobacula sp.]
MDKQDKTYDGYIKALTDISRAITSDLFIEDLLKLIVMVTAKVTGVEICSLWIVNEEEQPPKIHLKATQSISPDYIKDRALNLDEGVVGFVVTHKKPLILKDVLESELFKEKEMARKLGLVSMVGIPLIAKEEKVIGVLNCFTATPHDFSDTEVNLLRVVANQSAVAIVNTELMVKTRVIQEELEARKKIEQAKEVLMNKRQMIGAEAYGWIRKRSMDSRKSIREVAEAVILSNEIFNDE